MLTRLSLSVSHRIFLGFAAIVLLLIAASMVSVLRFNETADKFTEYLRLENQSREIVDLEIEFLSVLADFDRFHVSEEINVGEDAIAHFYSAQNMLQQQLLKMREDGQDVTILSEVDQNFERYESLLMEEMEAEIAAIMQKENYRETLNTLSAAMNDTLDGIQGTSDFLLVNAINGLEANIDELETMGRLLLSLTTDAGIVEHAVSVRETEAQLDELLGQSSLQIPALAVATLRDVKTALGALRTLNPMLREAWRAIEPDRTVVLSNMARQIIRSFEDAVDEQTHALESLGEAGQEGALETRNQIIIISVLAVILGTIASWIVSRSVVNPLSKLTHAFARLAQNDGDVELPPARADEFGSMRNSVQAIRDAAEEASSFRKAMDASGAMVMVSDAEHRIHFLSRALAESFRINEITIRSSLPNFAADQIMGSTVDTFFKDADLQRAKLDKLSMRLEEKLSLGDKRFDLFISPVHNNKGVRVASVLEWVDVTSELSLQQDIDSVIRGAIEGDFSNRVAAKSDSAVLSRIGTNVNALIELFDEGIQALQSTIGQMSEGDLSVRMAGDFKGAFGTLENNLNKTVTRLEELVGDIQITSQEINANTVTIADDARALSQRTESQAASLEETAATMEEMSSTIRNNAENAQTATGLASDTERNADQGGTVVREAVNAMARIEESSEKMSQIISVIDSIAFQTNLLALNAAVEAARAGDAGKGFAVVASEVRTLAQRSGEAAKDIKELIQFSSTHVTEGVELVHKTGDALGAIIGSIGKVNGAITDITAMSKEQATGVDEISSALSEMDGMTQKNAAMAEQSASRAGLLAEKANSLSDLVKFFRTGKDVKPAIQPSMKAESALSVGISSHDQFSAISTAMPAEGIDGNTALDPGWKEF